MTLHRGCRYDEDLTPVCIIPSTFCEAGLLEPVDLPTSGAKLEDEVEADVRRRIAGKHIEIASVTLESFELPPEIVAAMKRRLAIETTAASDKAASDAAWEKEKLTLERNVERRKLQREAEGLH